MLIYKILNEDIKEFMGSLLTEDKFNVFNVTNVEVHSFIELNLKGLVDKNFYNEDKEDKYVNWGEIQPYIYSFIKGHKTPKKITINFILPTKYSDKLYENCSACFLNMKFENGEVVFSTATAQKDFSLDKSLDILWNEYVLNFFTSKEIPIVKIDL